MQIFIDQREARRKILKKREKEQQAKRDVNTPADSIPYNDFKSQVSPRPSNNRLNSVRNSVVRNSQPAGLQTKAKLESAKRQQEIAAENQR